MGEDSLAKSAAPPGQATKPERAFEEIARLVRQDIASGVLRVGDKLAPERDLAKNFGVSRTAVREALRDLEGKGILRFEQGRAGGAFVRPPNASRVTHAIEDMLDIGSISLADLTEARVMFMEMVVTLAVARATEADFQALERNIDETDEFTRAGLSELRVERLGQFYTLLAEATRNSVLILIATALAAIVRGFLDVTLDSRRKFLATTVPSRRRFMRHLRERDVTGARAELNDHLIRLHKSLELAQAKHEPMLARTLSASLEPARQANETRSVNRPAKAVTPRD